MSGLSCGTRDLLLWRVGSSLVVARRLQGTRALYLWCTGSRARGLCSLRHAGSLVEVWSSVVVALGLSCPAACRILVP